MCSQPTLRTWTVAAARAVATIPAKSRYGVIKPLGSVRESTVRYLWLVPVIGAPTRILFPLERSSSDLEADRTEERVQVVADALIQTVELAALLFGEHAVAAEWSQ